MAITRERALEAAVQLVGEQGIRALTHARVDERAGLPKGSTSNWFRTRDALVAGVIAWIAESERADFSAGEPPRHRDDRISSSMPSAGLIADADRTASPPARGRATRCSSRAAGDA